MQPAPDPFNGIALLAAISSSTDDVIFAKDREGRIRFANPATLAIIGKPAPEVIGRTDLEILEDRHAARVVMENDRRIMESGRAEEVEEEIRHPDGDVRTWLSCKMPYRDAHGKVIGLLGISRDITERKRMVQSLAENQRNMVAVIEKLPVGIGVGDTTGRTLSMNTTALRLHGFASMDEMFAEPERYRSEFALRYPDGAPMPVQEWPISKAHAGEYVTDSEVRLPRPSRGLDIILSYTVVPVKAGGDAAQLLVYVIRDLTEQRAREAELKKARDTAEASSRLLREADRRKDQFLAVLSHELRNPLAPIANSIQLLEMDGLDDAQRRRATAVVRRQTQHLTRLVDDLLDITRIASGKVALRKSRVDLAVLAKRTVDDYRELVESRGQRLEWSVPANPVWVEADGVRIGQVIGNLLSNAMKFTPRGGRIAVSLAADGEAEIRVADTGAGIDPGMLEHLFEPFVQADSPGTSHGGLGLGLALVRGIVALHGGSTEGRSEGPGHGAEFIIRLPLLE